jgi:hypothetical protein
MEIVPSDEIKPRTFNSFVDSTPNLIDTGRPATFIHPEDVEGIVEKWRASLASGEPFLYAARVLRADGEYRWMLHHKVAVRDGCGQILKWYGSIIDIEDPIERKYSSAEALKSCKEASFISPKGSGLPTWVPV